MGAWQEARVGGRSAAATGYEERIDNESIANLSLVVYLGALLSSGLLAFARALVLDGGSTVSEASLGVYCDLYETTL